MTRTTASIMTAALLSTALWGAPAFAQQMGSSSEGSGEASRDAALGEYTPRGATPVAPVRVEDAEMRDAALADDAKLVEGFTSVTRMADGKETKTPPTDAMKKAVEAGANAPAGDQAGVERKDEDPALTEGGESRQVFGTDDRIQVSNTTVYPFTAIGYLEGKTASGKFGSCSGTLIGPRTVLTAAHCLYNHEDGGFLTEMIFVPGINGVEVIPFGGFQVESTTVLQGFIDNYKGVYGEVIPWDLGIITLKDPIGDSLGWLGYANYDNLTDFSANVVGYPGDKPPATMWRSTCDVIAENIEYVGFTYDCDTFQGSSGSAVYIYDKTSKGRIAVGVNVADSPEFNIAIRLHQANVEWINSLWK